MTEQEPQRPDASGTPVPPPETSLQTAADPGPAAVWKYLLYTCSVPERAIRAASGVVGGAARHSAELLVPQAFQDSRSYDIFVAQLLDFVIQDVGGVEKRAPKCATPPVPPEPEVENFVARATVGNFVDLAGIATMHVSPLVILALVSDIAYGSKSYLKELSTELKREGIIDQNSTIDGASDLLDALSAASGTTAQHFATPPISLEGLQKTIQETRDAAMKIDTNRLIPRAEVDRMWEEMRGIAATEQVSLLQVSTAMTLYTIGRIGEVGRGALSSVRVAGNMFDRHIFTHYRTALTDIHQQGYYRTLAETSKPYIAAVWKNFSSQSETVTEGILSGSYLEKAMGAVRGWLTSGDQDDETETPEPAPKQSPADPATRPPPNSIPPTAPVEPPPTGEPPEKKAAEEDETPR